jgi:hypothetical protein
MARITETEIQTGRAEYHSWYARARAYVPPRVKIDFRTYMSCWSSIHGVGAGGSHTRSVTAVLSPNDHPRAGTAGQSIRESGDTGDTCPRLLSPENHTVFAGQTMFGDTGDTFLPRSEASRGPVSVSQRGQGRSARAE